MKSRNEIHRLTTSEAIRTEQQVKTLSDFESFMVGIVTKKIPSWLYGYMPEEDNSDNYWWTPENPAYSLLVEMNKRGLLTFGSQDGRFLPGDIGIGRSFVDGVIRAERLPMMVEALELSRFKIVVHSSQLLRRHTKYPTIEKSSKNCCVILFKDPQTREKAPSPGDMNNVIEEGKQQLWVGRAGAWSCFLPQADNGTKQYHNFSQELVKKVYSGMVLVSLWDPVWTRPAEDGLFTAIVDAIRRK
jgi:hypothetical protein